MNVEQIEASRVESKLNFSLEFRNFLKEDPLAFIKVEDGNLLGADDVAVSVARLIDVSPEASLIGLWGDWGVGKTRILNLLRARLADNKITLENEESFELPNRKLKLQPVTAFFNPWQANANLMNWVETLSTSLIDAVEATIGIKVDQNKLKKKIKRATQEFENAKLWNNVKSAARVIAGLAGRNADSLEDTELDFFERDCVSWATTIKFLRSLLKPEKQLRFLVIVDDIDRCEPELIRVLLDTCFNHLIASNVTFLVATDRRSVVSSLAKLLPGQSDNAANKYLEKVVPIDFTVPKPTTFQVKDYVDCLMARANTAELNLPYVKLLRGTWGEVSEEHLIAYRGFQHHKPIPVKGKSALIFNDRLDSVCNGSTNPRRIKRMLTRYLRIVEVWDLECKKSFDGLGSKPKAKKIPKQSRKEIEDRFHLQNVMLLLASVNVAFIRESHPEFFNEILSDELSGTMAIKLLGETQVNTNSAHQFEPTTSPFLSMKNRMIELGFGSDNELMSFLDVLATCSEVPYSLVLNLAKFG